MPHLSKIFKLKAVINKIKESQIKQSLLYLVTTLKSLFDKHETS